MTDTQTPVQPARLWKQMPEAKRLLAAEAFWQERDGVEQQIEAMTLIARQLKARPKFVQGLPLEKKARYLASFPQMPDALAARLLVSYHLAHQRPMLKAFLDALGIAHEDGVIAADPEGPVSAERLATGRRCARCRVPARGRDALPGHAAVAGPGDLGRAARRAAGAARQGVAPVPWPAWAVHLLTASGAPLGLPDDRRHRGAGDYRRAFLWMAVATAIDSADGALARALRVKERLPSFNGARLDDIVDYLTFVFAPAYLVYHARLTPDALALVVVSAMLLSSAYGFSQEAAKTSDHYFTGFPSYWNIVVFYLVVLGAPPAVNAAVLIGLAVLVFVPIAYVYPSRTPTLRVPTLALGLTWALLVLVMIWQFPGRLAARPLPVADLPRLLLVLSLVLNVRRGRS